MVQDIVVGSTVVTGLFSLQLPDLEVFAGAEARAETATPPQPDAAPAAGSVAALAAIRDALPGIKDRYGRKAVGFGMVVAAAAIGVADAVESIDPADVAADTRGVFVSQDAPDYVRFVTVHDVPEDETGESFAPAVLLRQPTDFSAEPRVALERSDEPYPADPEAAEFAAALELAMVRSEFRGAQGARERREWADAAAVTRYEWGREVDNADRVNPARWYPVPYVGIQCGVADSVVALGVSESPKKWTNGLRRLLASWVEEGCPVYWPTSGTIVSIAPGKVDEADVKIVTVRDAERNRTETVVLSKKFRGEELLVGADVEAGRRFGSDLVAAAPDAAVTDHWWAKSLAQKTKFRPLLVARLCLQSLMQSTGTGAVVPQAFVQPRCVEVPVKGAAFWLLRPAAWKYATSTAGGVRFCFPAVRTEAGPGEKARDFDFGHSVEVPVRN